MKRTLIEFGIVMAACGIIALADLICYWQTGHYLFSDMFHKGDYLKP